MTSPTRAAAPIGGPDSSMTRYSASLVSSRTSFTSSAPVGQHQAVDQLRPAVDQHEQQQLERQRDRGRRQHHHAQRQQDVGHHQVDDQERQEDQEADLEGGGEFADGERRDHHDEVVDVEVVAAVGGQQALRALQEERALG